jgi:hypothetical protein
MCPFVLSERLVSECGVNFKFQQNISYFFLGYGRFNLFALFSFRPGKLQQQLCDREQIFNLKIIPERFKYLLHKVNLYTSITNVT